MLSMVGSAIRGFSCALVVVWLEGDGLVMGDNDDGVSCFMEKGT